MRYLTLSKVNKKLVKYAKCDREFFNLIRKQLKLFEVDENYRSLRNHKLKGCLNGYWSISINDSIRMIYFIENGIAHFINIGTHSEVYRVN